MKAEQFIKDYTMGCSNELCAVEDKFGKKVISFHEWLTPEQALRAVEIAREEMITWIEDNIWDYIETSSVDYREMFKSTILSKMLVDMRKTFENLEDKE